MSEDYAQASPEEKLRIASHFILSSPNGEVDEVIADVKTLMSDNSLLSDSVIEKLLKQYNLDNYVFAGLADGHNLPVSKIGHVDGNRYLDPSNGKVNEFDHVARKWNEEKGGDSHAEGGKFRSEIEKAVKKYMEGFYVNPKEFASAVYEKDGVVSILISAKRVNLGNFWSGGWKSTHTIDVSGKKGKLKTHINANVHYFEEGNVQLNTNYDEDFDVKLDDAEASGKEIADIIKNVENKFQKNMEEMYLNMHTQTFKAMRRFLPVTRTKMDWNPNAHRIADQLKV